jgi:hypothetical protein
MSCGVAGLPRQAAVFVNYYYHMLIAAAAATAE